MRVTIPTKDEKETYNGTVQAIHSMDVKTLVQWFFDWREEYKHPDRHVHKLIVEGYDKIEGAVSFAYDEGFILVEYLENAYYHYRKEKSPLLIAPPILAALCQLSEDAGFEGYVCIQTKQQDDLKNYYAEFAYAVDIGNARMIIDDVASQRLISVYLNKGGDTHGQDQD
ncbi:hypothetical protein J2S78_000148 [Salibacterium salarium]|uniref:hypothetical protein n=1 Tax=Salibacterium salarium TaxID=284579 RepID=UPI00278119CF|nr:hypothetical protein [Salibacterium salarium]MDQ0297740.1 hypothetical protein [Salibacterium salarium]